MMNATEDSSVRPNVPASPVNNLPAPVELESLMKGARELLIAYNGAIYRLQITRNGKLILKK